MKEYQSLIKVTARIVLVIILCSFMGAYAQGTSGKFYQGMDASMGIHKAVIRSDIKAIQDLSLLSEGGIASMVWGSSAIKSRLGAGFYYSSGSVTQTVDLFTTHFTLNVHPLNLFSDSEVRLSPYFVGGLVYDQYKFAGSYLEDNTVKRNNSVANDVYIGKVHQVNLNIGAGLEYNIIEAMQFLSVYTEIKYGILLGSEASRSAFENTYAANTFYINAGFRVGICRDRK